ncbi:MAG TPA: rod shape-determining protein RodA [Chloroflexia bacterium]|nr:rod shape-determining protein RodA [Chloroflexia bacterium]
MYRVTASQISLGARSFTQRWATFDYVLLLATLAACAFGVVMVYSATNGLVPATISWDNTAARHLFYAVLGVALMLLLTRVEYHMLASFVWPLYGGTVGLLALTSFLGHTAGGATRWIKIGDLPIQPSEIAKLVLALTLAKYLSDNQKRTNKLSVYLGSIVIAALPIGLIFTQPDLTTAVVCCCIWLAMVAAARLRWTFLAGTAVLGAAAGWAGWTYLLQTNAQKFQYMQDRLLIFLNPERDLYGQGYNILQARISIGAGGLFGKGFLAGTQSQLHFLKVQYADFIFSVVAEEFGLLGAVALVALLYVIVLRYLAVALRAPDTYGMLIAVGLAAWLAMHIFVNVAMNLSLMPVAGIPLPFISYGGSQMLSLLIAQGLLQSIAVRSRKVRFE